MNLNNQEKVELKKENSQQNTKFYTKCNINKIDSEFFKLDNDVIKNKVNSLGYLIQLRENEFEKQISKKNNIYIKKPDSINSNEINFHGKQYFLILKKVITFRKKV